MIKRDPKTIDEAVEMAIKWLATRPVGVAVPGDDDGIRMMNVFGLGLWIATTLIERNQNQHLLVADFYRRSERKVERGAAQTKEIVDFILGELRKRLLADGAEG